MAYDEKLAARVRVLLKGKRGVAERKMFGGIAFLLRGKMCCGVLNADLVARVGAENYATAVKRRHARPMNFTGRPIKGFVYVSPRGVKTDAALTNWLRESSEYILSLGNGKAGSVKRKTSRASRA